ncbi:hypothetical protein [Sphaerisporangium fuscum]|uniref:hypothetical protein n=1 Tax=Sphaerisporangium fuscum TaxID=2835868 RepID=UPI001BDBD1D6|nr:hypothetical protein [Sphaerisporangium fuscum]
MAVAVQLSADRITVSLVGLDRRITHVRKHALDGSETDPATLIPALADAVPMRSARGCLGTYADSRALLRAAGRRRHPGHEDTVTEIFDDAAAGDRAAREAIRLTVGHL